MLPQTVKNSAILYSVAMPLISVTTPFHLKPLIKIKIINSHTTITTTQSNMLSDDAISFKPLFLVHSALRRMFTFVENKSNSYLDKGTDADFKHFLVYASTCLDFLHLHHHGGSLK